MASSLNTMKKTLRELLAHSQNSETRFHQWFADELMSAADAPEALAFLLSVQDAFSDAGDGRYTPEQFRDLLNRLTSTVNESETTD